MIHIAAWIVLVRISYLSSLPVWYALYRRKRPDLIVFAIVVHISAYLRFEQLEYKIGYNAIPALDSNLAQFYMTVYKSNALEEFGTFMVSWSISVVLIYSAAFVSLVHERIFIFIVGAVLFVLQASELTHKLVIGIRLAISVPMISFFIYEKMSRIVSTYTNYTFIVSGYSLFYSGFCVAMLSSMYTNPEAVLGLHTAWVLLTNMSLVLIVLAVPPAHTLTASTYMQKL